ncbi:MAG TPA: type II toxin-antitoxin system VapC family toxin [Acidisarcina sp.]
MSACIDTSVLVSLYTPDSHSKSATEVIRIAKGPLLITTFAEFEFVNAMGLRVFRKEASLIEVQSLLRKFEDNLGAGAFQLIAMPDNVFDRACQLSRDTTAQHGTRTADLLHIAAALELEVDEFYSFDRKQRRLAEAANLKTNPML